MGEAVGVAVGAGVGVGVAVAAGVAVAVGLRSAATSGGGETGALHPATSNTASSINKTRGEGNRTGKVMAQKTPVSGACER